jgi:hypothetical protein
MTEIVRAVIASLLVLTPCCEVRWCEPEAEAQGNIPAQWRAANLAAARAYGLQPRKETQNIPKRIPASAVCGGSHLATPPGSAAPPTPAPGDVASLLCKVKNAIRFRERAWTPWECARVAEALSATSNPRLLAAMAIAESDLRPDAIAHVRPGVADVGLLQVRCVYLASSAPARATGARAAGGPLLPAGRCQNGPARGYTLRQLQDPETNIRVAAAVLEEKGGQIGKYNGATNRSRRARYEQKIAAIEAALGGKVVPVKGKRLRKLVEQIADAVVRDQRS